MANGKRGNAELLSQNYREMNSIGKEKLAMVAEQFLNIHKRVNEENGLAAKNNELENGLVREHI